MVSTTASLSSATALVRDELFASPGVQRNVPKVLDPEEQVLLALPGVAGDFFGRPGGDRAAHARGEGDRRLHGSDSEA